MYLSAYPFCLNHMEHAWLMMKVRWFDKHVCSNEKNILERLDQAILGYCDYSGKTQQTVAIGTLF